MTHGQPALKKTSFSLAQTFGLDLSRDREVTGFNLPRDGVPAVDDDYVFRHELIRDVYAWMQAGGNDGLLLVGPTGSGKTTLIEQIAARINYPVQSIAGRKRMLADDPFGQMTAAQGSTAFIDGPLAKAMRHGHWFVLNEITRMDPSEAMGLNEAVDRAPATITQNAGEVIQPHADYRFIATGNSVGSGDTAGIYHDELLQSFALMDRFWVVHVDYPDKAVEQAILERKVPQLPQDARDGLIDVANEIRAAFKGESSQAPVLNVTMSTRSLVRWASQVHVFRGAGTEAIGYALGRSLGFRCEADTRAALHEIAQRVLGTQSV